MHPTCGPSLWDYSQPRCTVSREPFFSVSARVALRLLVRAACTFAVSAGLHRTLEAARDTFQYYGDQGVTRKELELTLQSKANEGAAF
jgi:hypothetical protein